MAVRKTSGASEDFVIMNNAGPDSLRRELGSPSIATPGLLSASLQTSLGSELKGSLAVFTAGIGPDVLSSTQSVDGPPRASARGPVRNCEDETGSDAWQGPCLVL